MGETGPVMPQAAPPAPSTPAAPGKPKGAIGIWIGVLLIIGGIVLGIVLVVAGARSLFSGFGDLQRVPISGGGVVRIEEAGTQTVFAERPYSGSGSSFNTSSFSTGRPNVAVRIIGPGQSDIPLNTSSTSETYTYNGREGVSLGTFYASAPGTYRIVTQPQDGGGSWNMIAVGELFELSGVGAIVGGIFGGGLVVLIGIVVVIIFAVRRSRSKKSLMPAVAPYPSTYGGAPGGWPAAPGYAPPGAPGGYGTPPAPGGYGTPPAPGGWPASTDNPGWAAPPVVQPPGPTWTPPTSPPPQPQSPPADGTWPPPAPIAPPWQGGDAAPPADAPAPPPADPLAPSWEPPASSEAPPPPPPGDGSTPS